MPWTPWPRGPVRTMAGLLHRGAWQHRALLVLTLVLTVVSGCAPPTQPAERAAPGPGASEARREPKSLTIGIAREPSYIHDVLSQGESNGGLNLLKQIPQNYLV